MIQETSTVLIVDDEPAIQEVLASVLELAGHDYVTAGDGIEALEILERQRPDLLLLDLMMPRMNGWEFLQEVQRRRLLEGIPVIVLSAHYTPADISNLPIAAFLPKPFEVNQLLSLVETHLTDREHDEIYVMAGASGKGSVQPFQGLL